LKNFFRISGFCVFIVLFSALPCCRDSGRVLKQTERDLSDIPVERGLVSSAHPLASEAGIRILKEGGTAFDAAVAVAAALNVVEPMMSGMGGYGTILIYDARKEQIRFLDSSGKIPDAVNSDVFRAPWPDYQANRRGPKAVSTPGNVNAWEAMWKEYGRLEWGDLFKDALSLAQEGFFVSEGMAGLISRVFNVLPPQAREFYGKEGVPLNPGDRLIQKDLAESLRAVAEGGAAAFYSGEIGRKISQCMEDSGGFLSLDDLEKDRAEWWEPISINYKGFEVFTASPPSTAFPSLIRLGMMSLMEPHNFSHMGADYLHYFAEVTKLAIANRLQFAGDPGINPPPLDLLLSEPFWKEQARKIDYSSVRPFEKPAVNSYQGENTTHFVVADGWGNIVSATQTLGNAFGCRIMPEGTGIWLNNSLSYCTFEPKGNPMDAHAGRRKLSGDCPTIILKDGKPWAALGTSGGHTIGQTVPQMVMCLIDFEMDIQEAIAAPRISFLEPDVLAVESAFPQEVKEKLRALGHNVREVGGLGNAHGLMILYDEKGRIKGFHGGADPRGSGKAVGY
jgi:gamma-glutamyltranspeptidase/glutathione hydrolase